MVKNILENINIFIIFIILLKSMLYYRIIKMNVKNTIFYSFLLIKNDNFFFKIEVKT